MGHSQAEIIKMLKDSLVKSDCSKINAMQKKIDKLEKELEMLKYRNHQIYKIFAFNKIENINGIHILELLRANTCIQVDNACIKFKKRYKKDI